MLSLLHKMRCVATTSALVGTLLGVIFSPSDVLAINNPRPDYQVVSTIPVSGVVDATFTDDLHGWALASGDAASDLAETKDGGRHWQTRTLPTDDTFKRIIFSDARHGYIAGGNTILATADGGKHWRATTPAPMQHNDLIDVAAPTPHTLYALGQQSGPFVSNDGGVTWQAVAWFESLVADNVEFDHLVFPNSTDGWLSTEDSLYVTHDGGTTWLKHRLGPFVNRSFGVWTREPFYVVAFHSPALGIMATQTSEIEYADGIVSSTTPMTGNVPMVLPRSIRLREGENVTSVAIGSPMRMLVATDSDNVLETYDGMRTSWHNETFPLGTEGIEAVGFSGATPYVIEDDHFLRHTANGLGH